MGIFLYYAISINNTIFPVLSDISAEQAIATAITTKKDRIIELPSNESICNNPVSFQLHGAIRAQQCITLVSNKGEESSNRYIFPDKQDTGYTTTRNIHTSFKRNRVCCL